MTPEQEALLTKAKESLGAASLLASKGFGSIAVSRAYYAMFYIAQAFLEGKGLSYSKHSGVIAGFGQHFAKTGEVEPKFHRYLIEAEKDRLLADYGVDAILPLEEVQIVLSNATEFLQMAERVLSYSGETLLPPQGEETV